MRRKQLFLGGILGFLVATPSRTLADMVLSLERGWSPADFRDWSRGVLAAGRSDAALRPGDARSHIVRPRSSQSGAGGDRQGACAHGDGWRPAAGRGRRRAVTRCSPAGGGPRPAGRGGDPRSQAINPAWRRDRLLWCLAAAECGEPRAARNEAEKLLGLARRWGAAGAVGEALLVLGRLDGTDGVEVLRNAVDVLATSPRRIVHAEALTSLGTALAARGNASERVTEALDEAHTIGLQTGALRVAQQARAVLAAHQLPQPESVDQHTGRLTSIQQRMLQLTTR
jgi:hypothetical protein